MERPTRLERLGIYRLLRRAYDEYVRDRLPRKVGVYNGVAVRDRALFDVTDEQPDYEGALIAAIRMTVETGDSVVVVGGGRGVSTVSAAKSAGPSGSVVAFEGSKEFYDLLEETVSLNGTAGWTETRHAIVGEAVSVYGGADNAEFRPPSSLPGCDVLVMDCEGAELEILDGLTQRPRAIVVETHGLYDAPESAVRERLEAMNYEVVNRGIEYEEKGVFILTAHHRPMRDKTGTATTAAESGDE